MKKNYVLFASTFNRSFGATLAIILLGIIFSGCPHNTQPLPPPTVIETASATIIAANGGIIKLPNGSSLTIPPRAMSVDTVVTLSLLNSTREQPPSGVIIRVGTSLSITFGYGPASDTAPSPNVNDTDIELLLNYGTSRPPGLLNSAPLLDAIDVNGGDNFAGINGAYDSVSNSVSFSLPDSIVSTMRTKPKGKEQVASIGGVLLSTLELSAANLAPAVTGSSTPSLGGKVWNGEKWLPYPQGFDPTKKTLVLTHGVLSSIETAYPCVAEIMAAGGYQQVVGFDYDWTQTIDPNGQIFANFLNQLQKDELTSADIESHSLGTIVSLAAAGKTTLPINNMVLEAGPLDGTPIASDGWWITALSNFPWPYSNASSLQQVLESKMYKDVQTGSTYLTQVETNAIKAQPKARFIKVVGQSSPISLPAWLDMLSPFLGATNDGVIPSSSEEGKNLPGPTPLYFNDSHTDVECRDPNVIRAVGFALGGCSVTISPTASPTFTSNGGSGTIGVTSSSSGCSWIATPSDTWITLSTSSGTGSQQVSYSLSPNDGIAQRSGTITIEGNVFSILEDYPCSYAPTPPSISALATAGSYSLTVTAEAGCPWTASTTDSWISVITSSGNGTLPLNYSLSANNSISQRVGAITISGLVGSLLTTRTFTITQSGDCPFAITPTSESFAAAGGFGKAQVSTNPTCAWTATIPGNPDWLIITSGGSGPGSGTINFAVGGYNGNSPRSSTIDVGGQSFTVTQSASSGSGGGSGGETYDGTYSGAAQTVTPLGTSNGPVTVTVSNGYCTDPSGFFTGNVASNGNYTGNWNYLAGALPIPMSGVFSTFSSFTLKGSVSTTVTGTVTLQKQ